MTFGTRTIPHPAERPGRELCAWQRRALAAQIKAGYLPARGDTGRMHGPVQRNGQLFASWPPAC